jgi:hypothetical protein
MEPNLNLSRNDCPQTEEVKALVDAKRYRSGVGSIMHLAVTTRPDLSVVAKILAEALDNPSLKHFVALKRVLRYLRGTADYGIIYYGKDDPRHKTVKKLNVHGYCDADYAGDIADRKSTSGYVFMMNGGAISWKSAKQEVTAKSTVEAEYMSQASATQEVIWLQSFFNDVKHPADKPMVLYADNQGAMALANNPVQHNRTKHIDVRYHFIREKIRNGEINLIYCPTALMIADIMTKPLPRPAFERHREAMGIVKLE